MDDGGQRLEGAAGVERRRVFGDGDDQRAAGITGGGGFLAGALVAAAGAPLGAAGAAQPATTSKIASTAKMVNRIRRFMGLLYRVVVG